MGFLLTKQKERKTEMFVRKYKATNIIWDTDGEDVKLPTECVVDVEFGENPQGMDEEAIAECVGNAVSDKVGWCIKGHFNFYDMDDSPTSDEILERVKNAIEGCFDSVAVNADGTIDIKDGDGVYVLSVVKCEKCGD